MLPRIQNDMHFGVVAEAGVRDIAKASNPYDLDVQVNTTAIGAPQVNELITSKSLCTPGCGNTGTNNSFCC